jgi:hypothetical protein
MIGRTNAVVGSGGGGGTTEVTAQVFDLDQSTKTFSDSPAWTHLKLRLVEPGLGPTDPNDSFYISKDLLSKLSNSINIPTYDEAHDMIDIFISQSGIGEWLLSVSNGWFDSVFSYAALVSLNGIPS